MARVPRYTGSVQADAGQSQLQEDHSNAGAAGLGIAQAIQGAAATADNLSGALANHALDMQKRVNQSLNDTAQIEFTRKSNELLYDNDDSYYNLTGQAAFDAHKPTLDKLNELREQYSASLPNEEARGMFDQQTRHGMILTMDNMSSHAGKELRQWNKQSTESAWENRVVQAGLARSPEDFQARLGDVIDFGFESKNVQALRLDPETHERVTRKKVGEAYAAYLGTRQLSDPMGAHLYLEEHKADLDPDDYIKLGNQLKARVEPVIASDAADRAISAVSGGGYTAIMNEIIKQEGSAYVVDSNGAGVKYGINKKYHPDEDVKNMTEDRARAIYKEKYWDAIGGDNLPAELQGPAMDAAVVQGVKRARQWLTQSGGDVAAFNALRLAQFRASPYYAKYGKVWEQRVEAVTKTSALDAARNNQDVRALEPQVVAQINADPTLNEVQKKAAIAQAKGDLNESAIAAQARRNNNFGSALDFIGGGPDHSKPVTNITEALKDPNFNKAYMGLSEVDRLSLFRQIQQNARQGTIPMTPLLQEKMNTFAHEASFDPQSFLKRDFAKISDDFAAAGQPWPTAMTNNLIKMQGKIENKAPVPVNANTAMAMGLRPVQQLLRDSSIYDENNHTQNKEDYDHFWGAMTTHMTAYQQMYGKPPSQDEIVAFARNLVVGNKYRKVESWASVVQHVPDHEMEPVLQALRDVGVVKPTPNQVLQMYNGSK